jgi:GNAT superfamily N-acetyltransferase
MMAGDTMPDGSELRVKIATEAWEFEQIHALNHRTFAEEIPRYPANAARRLVDRFHDENTYVVALRGPRLVGMIAVRGCRPFSLDERLPGLDAYLPTGRTVCELRLLAVERAERGSRIVAKILEHVWRHCRREGFDAAIISGTTRQLKLYAHLGFVPFGPLIGTEGARFQPMLLTLERFAPRAPGLFRAVTGEPR